MFYSNLIQKRNKWQQHYPQSASTHLCFTEFTNITALLWCMMLLSLCHYRDSGLVLGGLNPIGENLFIFFFSFFSFFSALPPPYTAETAGAGAGAGAPFTFFSGGFSIPLKLSQESTRPWRLSSQFFSNSWKVVENYNSDVWGNSSNLNCGLLIFIGDLFFPFLLGIVWDLVLILLTFSFW